MGFRIGEQLTYDELRERIGKFQPQQVFPQIGTEIVCALLDPDRNPRAPEEVLVGAGPQMLAKARRLNEERTVVPVFVKRGTDRWEYRGRYHVTRMLEEGSPGVARIWEQRGRTDEPGIVLYLEQDEPADEDRHVTRYFTHYWTNRTWQSEQSRGYEELDHTASNQFRNRGVVPGDFIYVVTVIDGDLYLSGRMEVEDIVDWDVALSRLDYLPWEAEDHAMAKPGTGTIMDYDRKVPTDVVRRLRFLAQGEEVALVFKGGKLDQQTMRGVRELTFGSAQILEAALFPESEGRQQRARSDPSRIVLPPLDEILVEPPSPKDGREGDGRQRSPRKVDHAARDAANRALGRRGEEFVVEYERRVLTEAGRPDLARQVEHVSVTKGDGLGYDVQSFDMDGREKYIEVKTTTGGKRTSFIVTLSEVEFSEVHPDDFLLYRVFNFDKEPRMFVLTGSLRKRCRLEAVQFKARF